LGIIIRVRRSLMKSPSVFLLVLLSAAAFVEASAPTAPQFAETPLVVKEIRTNVYLVEGGLGANAGFVVGDKEVFVIDVKMNPESAKGMLAAIAKITPLPVTTIILTHSDLDHVNGFPGFPKGLKIVAQKGCAEELDAASAEDAFLKDYKPTLVFDNDLSMKAGGLTLVLSHRGPAHTNGDTIVAVPEAGVAFVGDLVFLGRDPLIHRRKNGSSAGLLQTLKGLLESKPALETFIPGHGSPAVRTDVEGLVKSIEEKQSKIKAMIADGRSLDDVKRAFGVVDPPAGQRRFPGLVEVIYLEFSEKK
jgi:cyclase